MGFHIRISDSSERMLKTLKASPEEIFPNRYHGYLLFLVGASDKSAMDWLVKNVVSLDSLTSKELAFGIFMRSLRIPIEVSGESETFKPKIAAEIRTERFKPGISVERIIKDHIYNHVYSGDEIMAITYATDEVAKEFNVTNKLPCVVLLDPIPFGNIQVVHLSDLICNCMIQILRQSIHKYLTEIDNKPNAFSYTEAILDAQKQLDEWEQKGKVLKEHIENLKKNLAILKGQVPSVNGINNIINRLEEAKKHIENGAAKKTRNSLFGSVDKYGNPNYKIQFENFDRGQILNFLEQKCPVLRRCIVTLDALNSYINDSTSFDWENRVRSIYQQYVSVLLEQPVMINGTIDKKQIREWMDQLENKKSALIANFYNLLPSIEEIKVKSLEEIQKKNEHIIASVGNTLKETEEEFENYTRNYISQKAKLEELLNISIRLYYERKETLKYFV